jgi:hypothetical protein
MAQRTQFALSLRVSGCSDELNTWIALCDRIRYDHVTALSEEDLRRWARSHWGPLADASRTPLGSWVIIYGQRRDQFVSNPSQFVAMANALRHAEVNQ